MNDQQVENDIQAKGLTALRVTPTDIEAEIRSVHYFIASDAIQHDNAVHESGEEGWLLGSTQLLTFCVIQLRNGFTVTGESACASSANFDAELGRKIARQNAVNKLWPLLGFRLRDRLVGPAPESIARVCHEVNRAYCEALGDNSQPAWPDAPEWQRNSAMLGVALHTNNPNAGPEASHESWAAQKVADGWVYGPDKDPEAKTHPCLVPFDQLPREQQAKDFLFRGVVHAMKER